MDYFPVPRAGIIAHRKNSWIKAADLVVAQFEIHGLARQVAAARALSSRPNYPLQSRGGPYILGTHRTSDISKHTC
jgi:hypothetical protein